MSPEQERLSSNIDEMRSHLEMLGLPITDDQWSALADVLLDIIENKVRVIQADDWGPEGFR